MIHDFHESALLLWTHWQAGTKIDALPLALRPTDTAQGHAVQELLPVIGVRQVVGWKIAATSAVGQAHIGVDGPLAGRILSGQVDISDSTQSLRGNGMRVAEPEFAFSFGVGLSARSSEYTVEEVLAAVDTLHPAIEIPDSRFVDFVHAGEAQLLADNACAHRLVLGPPSPSGWRSFDLSKHPVRSQILAHGACKLKREGEGSAVLGDPRLALTWLVNELSRLGVSLEAGQFVTTGTCMTPLEIEPGDWVQADYGVLGQVTAKFTE